MFFLLNTKTVLQWVRDEKAIRKAKKGSQHSDHKRPAVYPEMEERLYHEYKELRKKGLKVKRYWFKVHGRQLLEEANPDESFKFSDGWFARFKEHHQISFRCKTNKAQKQADDELTAIRMFHHSICKVTKSTEDGATTNEAVGKFLLCQIANVDKNPLSFCFTEGATYADKGEKTVWVRGDASGLEKRQCTVQVTIFTDGQPRVKPLIIFKETGK